MKKEVVFVVSYVNGGVGRVISLLANALSQADYHVSVIFTARGNDPYFCNNAAIRTVFLDDLVHNGWLDSVSSNVIMLFARLIGKLGFSDYSSIAKYYSRNFSKIHALKRYFQKHRRASIVAFLYNAIFLSLLSVHKSNRLIISERGDPCQSLTSKTDIAFFKKMFPKADEMVFQSLDVKRWYNENTKVKGTVIFNPIKADLPSPYYGERSKKIVNFCRLTAQKNLSLLVKAFSILNKEYPLYELFIFGNTTGTASEQYMKKVFEDIDKSGCSDHIHVLPARKDIHEYVKDYAMFVSSSDFEGMSNSMLEAMAIGLPVVCTDCPAGGARAVIRDHENGLLVPIKDAKALYEAMKEIIDDPNLSLKLSNNAVLLREELSEDKIMAQWEEVLCGSSA